MQTRPLAPRSAVRLLPFALVALLAVVPLTAPTVRTTFALLAGKDIGGTRVDAATEAKNREIAAAAPNDFAVQLASALETPTQAGVGVDPVPALERLQDSFGNRPALQAAIVRFRCRQQIGTYRPEFAVLEPPGFPVDTKPTTAADVSNAAAVESAAARGAALDPDNGFFPAMEAVALLGQHRDNEALAALHRSADAAHWNDYAADEIAARWKLQELRAGHQAALPMIFTADGTLYPHFAKLRGMARTTIGLAVEDELAGDKERGLAIRRDVARVGALLRVESKTEIGPLVGIAITGIADSRPGGAPRLAMTTDAARRTALNAANYVAYLNRIGHPDEASWWGGEHAAGVSTRAVFIAGSSQYDGDLRDIEVLESSWFAGLVVLVNAFWLVISGGLAWLACRRAVSGPRRGLPGAVRSGILLAIGLPVVNAVGLAVLGNESATMDSRVWIAWIACIVLMIAPFVSAVRKVRSISGLLKHFGAMAVTTLVCYEVAWLAASPLLGAARALAGQASLLSGQEANPNTLGFANGDAVLYALAAGAALVTVVVTAIFFAADFRRCGVPASVRILEGLRATALPIAGVLMLLYVATVFVAIRQEDAVRRDASFSVSSEPAHLAALAGMPLPGRVADPLRVD